MEYKEANLITINGGAAAELFAEEFRKVLLNVNDLCVPADTEREIKLTFKIRPTKDRSMASILIEAKSKLAGVEPHSGQVFIGHEGNKLRALTSDMKQGQLFDEKAQTSSVDQQSDKK